MIRIAATNRGPEPAPLHLLPTLWFRNTWAWGRDPSDRADRHRPAPPTTGDRASGVASAAGRLPPRRCRPPRPVLFTENETNTERLWGAPNATPYVKDAFHRARRRRRSRRGRRPGRDRDEGRRPLPLVELAPGATGRRLACACRWAAPRPVGLEADDVLAARRAEADAFYAPLAGRADRRRGAGPAAGVRRADLDQAGRTTTTSGEWLDGDPAGPPPPDARRARSQRRLARAQHRRRPVHARHLGVPLVRRLGPGLPLPAVGADRPGLRQGPAAAADARVVHAPQRPAARLRVGLLRRQPAGPRLGGLARLQDRPAASTGTRRPRLPGADLPQAAAQLHLVGQPQGPRRPQRLPGRLPRARQHRRRSTAARRCPVAGHLAQADGTAWMGFYSPEHAGDRARAGARGPGLRGRRHQVLRALPVHRRGAQRHRRRRASRSGTTRTSSSTTCSTSPTASTSRSRSARWSGSSRCWRSRRSSPSCSTRLPEFRRRLRWFLHNRPELAALVRVMGGAGRRRPPAAGAGPRPSA